jgi:hypothetical protein
MDGRSTFKVGGNFEEFIGEWKVLLLGDFLRSILVTSQEGINQHKFQKFSRPKYFQKKPKYFSLNLIKFLHKNPANSTQLPCHSFLKFSFFSLPTHSALLICLVLNKERIGDYAIKFCSSFLTLSWWLFYGHFIRF